MKDPVRREHARLRAEQYAPHPKDSRLLYGAIAGLLFTAAIVLVGNFYAIDIGQHPVAVGVMIALAVLAGLIYRHWRRHQHKAAHREEYALGKNPVGKADPL